MALASGGSRGYHEPWAPLENALKPSSLAPLALILAACTLIGGPEKEAEVGRVAADQVEARMGLVEDASLVGYVRQIGERLVRHAPQQELEYQFLIVDALEPNAFALPGGYIYVSRGLLVLVNSEAELANVIGHEIAHVAARHHAKREVRSVPFLPLRIVAGIGAFATGLVSPTLGSVVSGIGELPGALLLAPYSRGQERAADRLGQELAAAAGWDPGGMASFMETLNRDQELHGDERGPSFLSTHPSSSDRRDETATYARTLTRATPSAIAPSHATFLERLDGLLVGPSGADGVFVAGRFLHADLGLAMSFPPGWDTLNTPRTVAARSPSGEAFVLLELVGEGDDPYEVALALLAKGGVDLSGRPKRTRIGELDAAWAVGQAGGLRKSASLELTWIAHGELVYQITGVSTPNQFNKYRHALHATARSFRPITATERSQVREPRLRLVRAREGETLRALLSRMASSWSPEEAAVANGMEPATRIPEGTWVKVAILEVYRGAVSERNRSTRRSTDLRIDSIAASRLSNACRTSPRQMSVLVSPSYPSRKIATSMYGAD